MFFRRSQIDLAELPLERLPLSREDLFVLFDGCDSGGVACNVGSMDLASASMEKSWQGPWRESMVGRLHPAGWVDAEGNPSPELERALAPLRKPGLTITDRRAGKDRTMGVTMGDDGATGLVQAAPGIFNLRPFPDDRSRWPQSFRELFDERRFPFQAAAREWHERFVEYDTDPLFRALNTNDRRFVRNYCAEHGLDAEPMLELAHAVGSITWRRYEVFVDDRRGCTMGRREYGWNDPDVCRGPVCIRWCIVVPKLGAMYARCHAAHEGIPEDWCNNFRDWEDPTAFVAVDFYEDGDLFHALDHAYPWPGESNPSS